MNLTDLFKANFYFKGAVAAIHLSGTTIIQEATCSNLVFSIVLCSFKQALSVIPFFIGIELIHKCCCSHPFDELPFFYCKRVIAATHSFKLTVFAEQELKQGDTNNNYNASLVSGMHMTTSFPAIYFFYDSFTGALRAIHMSSNCV